MALYMGLMTLGQQKYTCSRTTSAGAKCLWGWVGYWKAKNSQITRYWPNPTKIKGGSRTIRYGIHKLIVIWNKEELPEEWKESIIVPTYNKGDKTVCSTYTGISLLPTTYKILFNILQSRLIPHAEEIIGVNQRGFRRNRSTIEHKFCICQMLQKNGNNLKQCINYLQTSRKLVVQLGGRSCTIFSLSLGFP